MRKNLLSLLIILTLCYSADAQWYYKKCGVIDLYNCTPSEMECLNSKTRNLITAGTVTTILGTVVLIGGISTIESNNDIDSFSGLMESAIMTGFGVMLAGAGVLINCVGIPLIIAGAVRKSELNKIPDFNNLNPGSLNLSPTIRLNQYNNTLYAGLTLSFNF